MLRNGSHCEQGGIPPLTPSPPQAHHNAHNNAHVLTFFILITHHLREIAFIQSILLRNGSHCEPWLTIYGGHVTMRLTCDQMEMAVT